MRHIDNLLIRYPHLSPLSAALEDAYNVLIDCVSSSGKIFTCGNGGSAADAEHIVGELMKGFRLKRELTFEQQNRIRQLFPEQASVFIENLQRTIPAISLVSSISLSTAFANDVNPNFLFAQQIFGLGKPGDVLIAISTSGNSANVLYAAQTAKIFGLKVVALTGKDGGKLVEYADVALKAPADDVATIQELHVPIYHCICAMLEESLFGEKSIVDMAEIKSVKTKRSDNFIGLKDVQVVFFDFDGVFTDNKVYTSQHGEETVACDRRDSLGLDALKRMGMELIVLSTETNPVVLKRAEKLGLSVETGCRDKKEFLNSYLMKKGIDPKNVVYMGNDLNDFQAMCLVGHKVVPADAHPILIKIASLVLKNKGGQGAVRELCEIIMVQKKGGIECLYL